MSNNMEELSEKIHQDLTSFINSLGKDVIFKQQTPRECYSSISKIKNKVMRLVWLWPYKKFDRKGNWKKGVWKIWIRKQRPNIEYPSWLYEMPEYDDIRDRGYPNFEIHSLEDLEKTKKIIKFAYERL
jgi:hypothetical protein